MKKIVLWLAVSIMLFAHGAHAQVEVYAIPGTFPIDFNAPTVTLMEKLFTQLRSTIADGVTATSQAITSNNTETIKAQHAKLTKLSVDQAMSKAAVNAEPAADGCAAQALAQVGVTATAEATAGATRLSARGQTANKNAGTPQLQAQLGIATHTNKYCGKDDPLCKGKAAKPNGKNGTMENGDAAASTLFSGAGNDTALADAPEDLTYTTPQAAAAQDYIANLVDGAQAPQKAADAELQTPAGYEYEAKRLVYEAKMSIPRTYLNGIRASRMPNAIALEALKQIQADTPSKIVKDAITNADRYHNGKAGDQGISAAELLRVEATRRVASPEWHAIIGSANDTALLREIATMMATSLQMQYQASRAAELTGAIAAQNSIETISAQMLPKLQNLQTSMTAGR